MIFQELQQKSFPYWKGPYSPARGVDTGIKVKDGEIGAWCYSSNNLEFFSFEQSPGSKELKKCVSKNFGGGGRIVILPNGFVIKPLADETGYRKLIGKIEGEIEISLDSGIFSFGPNVTLKSGSIWKGPYGGGLECKVLEDGSIMSSSKEPHELGKIEAEFQLTGANPTFFNQVEQIKKKLGDFGRLHFWYGGHLTAPEHQVYIGCVKTNVFDTEKVWIS